MKASYSSKCLSQEKAVKKLIDMFPDAISAYHGSLNLDFVTTCDRLAKRVMDNMTDREQLGTFGRVFTDSDDCARFIATYMFDLSEQGQDFLDKTYSLIDGDIYGSPFDEDDEDEYDD